MLLYRLLAIYLAVSVFGSLGNLLMPQGFNQLLQHVLPFPHDADEQSRLVIALLGSLVFVLLLVPVCRDPIMWRDPARLYGLPLWLAFMNFVFALCVWPGIFVVAIDPDGLLRFDLGFLVMSTFGFLMMHMMVGIFVHRITFVFSPSRRVLRESYEEAARLEPDSSRISLTWRWQNVVKLLAMSLAAAMAMIYFR